MSLEAEDRLGVPSLGAGGQAEADLARTEAGEGEGSDWASVASFPVHDEVICFQNINYETKHEQSSRRL